MHGLSCHMILSRSDAPNHVCMIFSRSNLISWWMMFFLPSSVICSNLVDDFLNALRCRDSVYFMVCDWVCWCVYVSVYFQVSKRWRGCACRLILSVMILKILVIHFTLRLWPQYSWRFGIRYLRLSLLVMLLLLVVSFSFSFIEEEWIRAIWSYHAFTTSYCHASSCRWCKWIRHVKKKSQCFYVWWLNREPTNLFFST